MRKGKNWVKIGLAALLCLLIVVGALFWWIVFASPSGNFEGRTAELIIPTGASLNEIVALLLEKEIIGSRKNFTLTAKIFGCSNKLKAGKYEIALGLPNYEVLKILVKGKVLREWVTIQEGSTSRQIASKLQNRIGIDSTKFLDLVNDSTFAQSLGIKAPSLEGYLFPETYSLYWGMNEKEVITLFVKEFQRRFTDSLRTKARQMGMGIHEIVTLASIIEGEAMVDSERTIISAVYHNRLKRGIRLQADPTIQYIIPDSPRRLLNRDLKIDSPYNTYLYPGLPPGPVNNPGMKSIVAALDPAPVNYLYFVARGDGSHVFSTTSREHLKAKRKFDRYRREVNRQRKQKK